jgi:hypothetical protein
MIMGHKFQATYEIGYENDVMKLLSGKAKKLQQKKDLLYGGPAFIYERIRDIKAWNSNGKNLLI